MNVQVLVWKQPHVDDGKICFASLRFVNLLFSCPLSGHVVITIQELNPPSHIYVHRWGRWSSWDRSTTQYSLKDIQLRPLFFVQLGCGHCWLRRLCWLTHSLSKLFNKCTRHLICSLFLILCASSGRIGSPAHNPLLRSWSNRGIIELICLACISSLVIRRRLWIRFVGFSSRTRLILLRRSILSSYGYSSNLRKIIVIFSVGLSISRRRSHIRLLLEAENVQRWLNLWSPLLLVGFSGAIIWLIWLRRSSRLVFSNSCRNKTKQLDNKNEFTYFSSSALELSANCFSIISLIYACFSFSISNFDNISSCKFSVFYSSSFLGRLIVDV